MKLFASDYDGTLRITADVSNDNKKMIDAWRAAGNLFVIVTGRSMESITAEQQRNQFSFDYLISNNGGVIYDAQLQKLSETLMDYQKALGVLAYIKTISCISYVINDGFHRAKVIVNPHIVDRKYGQVKPTMDAEEILANQKIAQFVLSMDDMDLAKRTAAELNEKFHDLICAYVNVDCIDIVPKHISKAKGVSFIASRHHIKNEDIFVIGDSYNDLPMIEAYDGFTLNHAEAVIKAQATNCYPDVAQALIHVLKLT